jgi:hypothetical protein
MEGLDAFIFGVKSLKMEAARPSGNGGTVHHQNKA